MMPQRQALLLGVAVWLLGFALSLVLFTFVPLPVLGWVLLGPLLLVTVGAAAHVDPPNPREALPVALGWLGLALILDNVFVVRLFGVQAFYDLDVAVYYAATFAIPLLIGVFNARR